MFKNGGEQSTIDQGFSEREDAKKPDKKLSLHQTAMKLKGALKVRRSDLAKKINLSEGMKESDEIQSVAIEMFKEMIGRDSVDAKFIKDNFLTKANLESPEVQKAIVDVLLKRLPKGYDSLFLPGFLSKEKLQSPEIQEAGIKGICSYLEFGLFDNQIQQIIDNCYIPENILESPRIRESGEKGVTYSLSNFRRNGIDRANNLIKKLNLPEENVKRAVELAIENLSKEEKNMEEDIAVIRKEYNI